MKRTRRQFPPKPPRARPLEQTNLVTLLKSTTVERPAVPRFYHDLTNETLIMRDRYGELRIPLADFRGKFLTLFMLRGLEYLLKKERDDPRSTVLRYKNGIVPRHRPAARKRQVPPKPARPPKVQPLTTTEQAIVAALLDDAKCVASYAEAEALVRKMDRHTKCLWLTEPLVKMHRRRLMGQPISSIDRLAAKLLNKDKTNNKDDDADDETD